MQQLRPVRLRELQHVEDSENARLRGEDRPRLVMDRGRGAGKIINLIELHVRDAVNLHPRSVRIDDIVIDEREVEVPLHVGDVSPRSRVEIVEGIDPIAVLQQPPTKMTAEKSRAASN